MATIQTTEEEKIQRRQSQGNAENGVFETARVEENEIVKEQDITMGFNSSINNIAIAINAIMGGGKKDFVIGGKVNLKGNHSVEVQPFFAYSNKRKQCVVMPKSKVIDLPQGTQETTYILAIRIDITTKDVKDRAFVNPNTGFDAISEIRQISTQQEFIADVFYFDPNITQDIPADFDTCIKIAEVTVPQDTGDIRVDDIIGIEATTYTQINNWKIEVNSDNKKNESVYCMGGINDFLANFLVQHTQAGEHKDNVITKDNIQKDVAFGEGALTGGDIRVGGIIENLKGENIKDTTIKGALQKIAQTINCVMQYIYTQGAFSVMAVHKIIEGNKDLTFYQYEGNEGQLVLLIGQNEKAQNGLYCVQNGGKLARYVDSSGKKDYTKPSGYAGVLFRQATTENGIVCTLKNDPNILQYEGGAIEFEKISISSTRASDTLILRDSYGRAQVSPPQNAFDIATKNTVDTAKNELNENINTEKTARENADSGLSGDISKEIKDRGEADTSLRTDLQGNIDTETGERIKADNTLQGNIDTEKGLRESVDTALNNAIQDEATARGEADNAINDRITEVISLEGERHDDIYDEFRDRDEKLSNRIDELQKSYNNIFRSTMVENNILYITIANANKVTLEGTTVYITT